MFDTVPCDTPVARASCGPIVEDEITSSGAVSPLSWHPALDAVVAAPRQHKVLFENARLRVLEVTPEPKEEEPTRHHRWPSVLVFDRLKPPVVDLTPEGERMPPTRDVLAALEQWDGKGRLVDNMAPHPDGRVLNESDARLHGIRIEMKTGV